MQVQDNKQTVTNYDKEREARGSGQLKPTYSYLEHDPISYAHEYFKSKDKGQRYIIDKYWSEAARRGESEQLSYAIEQQLKAVKKDTQSNSTELSMYDQIMQYGDRVDYDTYMLALEYELLDDKEAKPIYNQQGELIGNYTNKSWAKQVLDSTIKRWTAELVEEDKETMNWFAKAGATIFAGLAHVTSGVIGAFRDLANLCNGINNVAFSFLKSPTDIKGMGAAFLEAFANDDDILTKWKDYTDRAIYDLELYCTGVVDAVDAYEQGRNVVRTFEQSDKFDDTAVGAGYTTWGNWFASGLDSIGYMLPSILLGTWLGSAQVGTEFLGGMTKTGTTLVWKGASMSAKAIGAIQTSMFYGQIFSGMVQENVKLAENNGISIKDMNAGTIIGNALVKSAAQWAIEEGLGMVLGFSGLDRLMGITDRAGSGIVSKATSNVVARKASAFGTAMLRGAKDMAKEGLEEVLQDMSDGFIDEFVYGKWMNNEDYQQRGIETFNINDLVSSFVVGALTSAVIGCVKNAKVINPNNRAVAIDENGKTYRMGIFEALNYNEAMNSLQDWIHTIRDVNTSVEDRANAAFKISTVVGTIGNVLKTFGNEKSLKILQMLDAYNSTNSNTEKQELKTKLSDASYAEALIADFKQSEQAAGVLHDINKAKKLQEAINKKAKVLKENNVNNINEIVTETTNKINSNDEATLKIIKQLCSEAGIDILVGTDGNIITRSDDVVFVPDSFILTGNTSKILEGITYESAVNTVINALSISQKNLILNCYNKITKSKGTINQAVTALLFDKSFYGYVLMKSSETKFGNKSIELLATIDKIIKGKISGDVAKGKLSQAAFNKLMNKIKSSMQAGIVTYATTKVRLDLGVISNDILPLNLKRAIEEHRNVVFSNQVDEITKQPPSPQRTNRYKQLISKFAGALTQKDINELTRLASSPKYNDRVCAKMMLIQLCNSDTADASKLIYLPFETNLQPDAIETNENIAIFEAMFNAKYTSILNGDFEITNVSQTVIDYFKTKGLSLTNEIDRLTGLRAMMYEISNHTLTIGNNGQLLQILDKQSLLKEEYLGQTGDTKLLKDIREGKVKTVSDICKVKIDSKIGNLKIVLDVNMKSFGQYINGGTFISVNGNRITDTIMHEATHATQYYTANNMDIGYYDVTMGGTKSTLSALPEQTINDIDDYIKENFNFIWNWYNSRGVGTPTVIYFMLEGEMQANTKLTSIMFEAGFTFSHNYEKLVSPDGKKSWNLRPENKHVNEIQQKTQYINADAPLEIEDIMNLGNTQKIYTFMKDSILKYDVNIPILFYRGTNEINKNNKNITYYSTDPFVAYTFGMNYTEDSFNESHGYVVNLKANEIVFINMQNNVYDKVPVTNDNIILETGDNQIIYIPVEKLSPEYNEGMYDNSLYYYINNTRIYSISTDAIVDYIYNNLKQYKGIYFQNVNELVDDSEIVADDLALFDTSRRLQVTTDDSSFDNSVLNEHRLHKYSDLREIYNNKRTEYASTTKQKTQSVTDFLVDPTIAEKAYSDYERETGDYTRQLKKLAREGGRVYVNNTRANKSNMKYFVKKGKPIIIHPAVLNFVEKTTSNFGKLPKYLQSKIMNGTLNLYDIINYVQTAADMDDYTFKSIAKFIYNNDEAAKLSAEDMYMIFDNIMELGAVAKIVKDRSNELYNSELTVDDMFNYLSDIRSKRNTDKKFFEDTWAKSLDLATKVWNEDAQSYDYVTVDPEQLNSVFFNHFNGTWKSIATINSIGKHLAFKQTIQSYGSADVAKKSLNKQGGWKWIDKARKADINYRDYSELQEVVEEIDTEEKKRSIEDYIISDSEKRIAEDNNVKKLTNRLNTLSMLKQDDSVQEEISEIKTKLTVIYNSYLDKVNKKIAELDNWSDEEINNKYVAVIANEASPASQRKIENIVKTSEAEIERTGGPILKNVKDSLRNEAKDVISRLPKLKAAYDLLPDKLKNIISRDNKNNFALNNKYESMSEEELRGLVAELQKTKKEIAQLIRQSKTDKKLQSKAERILKQKIRQLEKENQDLKKKTMKQKVDVIHEVNIKEENFSFMSKESAPESVKKVLATSWDKKRMSTVQALTNNQEQDIANGKQFFEQNANTLLAMTTTDAEEAARWLIDSNITMDVNSPEYKKFIAIRLLMLGAIYSEAHVGGRYEGFNNNLKQKIEDKLHGLATEAGTALATWQTVLDKIDPLRTMWSNSEIDGVELTEDEVEALIKAAKSGDMKSISDIQNKIVKRISEQKTSKRSFSKRLLSARNMAMLSSPLTWLRNQVSNFMLKRLNKISAKIGGAIFTGHTNQSQLKLKTAITPEIQNYINENFLDNGMFDALIGDLSKYSPSDIKRKFKNPDGTINKDAIFANMVVKSMYNKYYNEKTFNTPMMNNIHKGLMKVLSDNNYIREASVRYFGQIIAEKGYDLTQGITDAIMTDFGNAVGIAMSDYMHSDNFMNEVEKIIAERGESWHFVYKLLLPYGASTWNWFKAAIRYSPIGLAQSIVKFTRLENTIRKAEASWAAGKSNISPEMTEYLVRRDLGSGIIGTSGLLLGMLLSSLGFIRLDDDDRDEPKLFIGNLAVDVKDIFGTSSLLAGAAFVGGISKESAKGKNSWESILAGLDGAFDVTLDGFFLVDIMTMDLYSKGGTFATGLDFLESVVLSFVPNMMSYLAGMTYTGNVKKTTLWQKAIAKIPFLNMTLPKKIDPYTGKDEGAWAIFNRVVPYLEVKKASHQKQITKDLGLNKSELTGKYTVDDKTFNLSAKDTAELNKIYGQWNAKDLEEFYTDKKLYRVLDKTTNKFVMLSYSQMTDAQRRNTAQSIMSDNATYARVFAWLKAGHKYYASNTEYTELIAKGVKGNLYKGDKGYIDK